MKIELAMKILQVAMSIDEPRQNGLALYIDDLSAGGNSDFAAPADSLESARLNNDHGILDRRPAGPVNQFSTLHNKYLLCHQCFSSVLPISGLLPERIFLLTLPAGHLSSTRSAKYWMNGLIVNARSAMTAWERDRIRESVAGSNFLARECRSGD